LTEKLSQLENPSYDMIDAVIKEFAVPANHQPFSHTLTSGVLNMIER
jgi:hypothetical protein